MRLRSALGACGVRWPAVPSPRANRLLALLYQLQDSECWSAERLREAQQEQAGELLHYARKEVPLYAGRLKDARPPEPGSTSWLEIPLLTREDVQQHAADLRSRAIPASHGRVFENRTSGSTGQPVAVLRTGLTQLLWEAISLREHLWQHRDASLTEAIIRANGPRAPAPEGRRFAGWGIPFDLLWKCGPAHALDMRTDVAAQAAWLRNLRPDYFLTYPSNLEALLEHVTVQERVTFREVICVGEAVSDELRKRCMALTGARITSNYSSQELGYIALQCPDCGQFHVQSESVYVEILDEEGHPSPPGTVGRVVVTDLHNFAMPLIRYVIGDYAQIGEPCRAGRGLPSLRRVLGRRRNMLLYPDGRRTWPLTGFARFGEVAPIRQYQFIQHSRSDIEVRLVVPKPLAVAELRALSGIIVDSLGHPFRLRFRQFPRPLPRTRGGKFEEFVCLAQ